MNLVSIPILCSVLAGVLYGITESLNKRVTEKKYPASSYALLQWLGNLLLYAIPFFIFGSIPKEPIAYMYLLILTIFVFVGNIFIIQAYKTEDLSTLNILSRISLVISFFAGILLLSEQATAYKYSGVGLILLGIIIMFYEGKKIKITKGLLFALLSGLFFGLTAYFDKRFLEYASPVTLLFLFNVLSVSLFIFRPRSIKAIVPILKRYKWLIILSRITAVVGFYLQIWSLSKANISIIGTNFETFYLISTAIIGMFVFKEKLGIRKKIIGSGLCILGVILLNFF